MRAIYDCEIYPNCFLLCVVPEEGEARETFEISFRKNDLAYLEAFILQMRKTNSQMVGFNNLAFDYPLLHFVLTGKITDPRTIHDKAQQLILSESKFGNFVSPRDWWADQIDLLRIHHFDNKARMTSLKTLEFNMRSENIQDLPFRPGTHLTSEQIDVLEAYCFNDVLETRKFYRLSMEKIAFREKLTDTYQRSFMNFSDVKIGKEVFQIALENSGVKCFEFGPDGRQPIQTFRPRINLGECVPEFIRFRHPEFQRVLEGFRTTTVNGTKATFQQVAHVDGIDYVFGTGGIHASIDSEELIADDDTMLYDIDVTSMYPSIAISQGYYPEHLGPTFVKVYEDLRRERVRHPKNSPENAMLKLALNGVYGASGDVFSCFYDPLFTMKITVGGQLMIAMLVDNLRDVPGLRVIQANTDGVTVEIQRTSRFLVDAVCQSWEQLTGLALEYAEFSRMVIADVNSYLAVKTNGETKRKGRYEYTLDWNKDASALVVPKVVEQHFLEGADSMPILERIKSWPDRRDFMLRIKVNRGSRLSIYRDGEHVALEDKTLRYFLSREGWPLTKIMPPLKDKKDERLFNIHEGNGIIPCNNLRDGDGYPINYEWYAAEAMKLINPIR